MMDRLPAYPLEKACSFFKQVSNHTEQITNNPSVLTQRQKDLFHALNNFLGFYTNYTGKKDCKQAESITPVFKNTIEGWNTLMCTSISMPVLDGHGSIFPNLSPQKYDYFNKRAMCK